MKVKVSEATNKVLDYLVAKSLGIRLDIPAWASNPWVRCTDESGMQYVCPHYTTDWAQGGPIIERERICTGWIIPAHQHRHLAGCWSAHIPGGDGKMFYGPTALIAAMRCFVVSKLGDEVDVPQELMA